MMTLAIILGLALLTVAFVLGLVAGRKTVTTGSPTPQSANAAASPDTIADADAAAKVADDKAMKKSEEVLHASDDDTRARVAKLRARGRAGE